MPRTIGILELTALPATSLAGRIWTRVFAPRYASVMSQAVSVWLRQAGHRVHYAVYSGSGPLLGCLPQRLDYLFIVTTSRTAGLAEAVAGHYRRLGTRVVACGAYPASQDWLRWASVHVRSCNREAILDLVESQIWPPARVVIKEPFDLQDLPSLADREPEVRSTFHRFAPRRLRVVPLLHSVGCPNRCSFCTERDREYKRIRSTRIFGDLYAANKLFPGSVVAWHDPNWGMGRDVFLPALEAVRHKTNRYLIELELRHVKPLLLKRLKRAGVAFLAVGIESWTGFHGKAGIKARSPDRKMREVLDRLRLIHEFIPYVQANFIIGFDDEHPRTIELLKQAVVGSPWCHWNVGSLHPFPGTEVHDTFKREGRLLSLPPEFMCDPFLVHVPKHGTAVEFYERMLDLYKFRLRHGLSAFAKVPLSTATITALRLAEVAESVHALSRLLQHRRSIDRFHAGSGALPKVYSDIHKRWLSLAGVSA